MSFSELGSHTQYPSVDHDVYMYIYIYTYVYIYIDDIGLFFLKISVDEFKKMLIPVRWMRLKMDNSPIK